MSFYFVCPGEAAVSETQVQCSAAITTFDPGWQLNMSPQDKKDFVAGVFTIVAILIAAWLIKHAIDT